MNDLMKTSRIGVIAGSGLQKLLALQRVERVTVNTPFGEPSDQVVLGELDGVPIAFLQRHGQGHRIPPSDINVRANIAALRRVGCTQVLSLSAVGSLAEECPPGTFVLVDQYIDRTIRRQNTYFGPGLVGHVPFGDPVCCRMHETLGRVAVDLGLPVRRQGTYVVMEGPQFSSRAESMMHRSFGGTVIGMTGMPEPKLAREAELCYAMVAMVTDYDCWHDAHEDVTADLVGQRMELIAEHANRLVAAAAREIAGHHGPCSAGCSTALDRAIMTAASQRDPAMLERLAFVAPRIFSQSGDSQ